MKKAGDDIRREYLHGGISEVDMLTDPVQQFNRWFDEAVEAGVDLPNAMALATSGADNMPAVRYVLMKGFSQDGFIFYTHSISLKGRHLAENPQAAALFYWSPMDRQVRLSGGVVGLDEMPANAYFRSRPRDSQISAWVAAQSSVVESRAVLEAEFNRLSDVYGDSEIPRPPGWQGYRLRPDKMEFWQGRAGRLHDRIEYIRKPDGDWDMHRLAP